MASGGNLALTSAGYASPRGRREFDMKQIIYVSRPAPGAGSADEDEIIRCSVRNNPELGITGVLVIAREGYLQLLEGPSANIDALMSCIAEDTRHTGLVVLEERPLKLRAFPDWAMGRIEVGGDSPVLRSAFAASGESGPAAPGLIDAVIALSRGMESELRAG
jgi:hypothetical protein